MDPDKTANPQTLLQQIGTVYLRDRICLWIFALGALGQILVACALRNHSIWSAAFLTALVALQHGIRAFVPTAALDRVLGAQSASAK